ncbi:MAG: Rid family hydrolase [Bifidobacteriaceae bacterium]|jgi:reactive intermediate/imine deaminase|nr:Rid family hydrolase [Bifidobacteriaceae bacterium]
MTNKKTLKSLNAPTPAGPYSHAVITKDSVYTAGFGPIDPKTGKVDGDDIYTQTLRVLNNIKTVLNESGTDISNVVKVTAYLQNLQDDFAGFNKAYAEVFSSDYPVRTTIGATLSGILVEIDAIAVL